MSLFLLHPAFASANADSAYIIRCSAGQLPALQPDALKDKKYVVLEGELANPKQFFHLLEYSGVEKFVLDRNNLSGSLKQFAKLKSIHSLVITGSPDIEYDKLFSALAALDLKELKLEDNSLSTLPASLGKLAGLEKLSVINNDCRSAEDVAAIGKLDHLLDLNLSANDLKELPDTICRLTALKQLDVSNNKLAALPAGLAKLKNLNELYLQGNNDLDEIRYSDIFAGLPLTKLGIDKPDEEVAAQLRSHLGSCRLIEKDQFMDEGREAAQSAGDNAMEETSAAPKMEDLLNPVRTIKPPIPNLDVPSANTQADAQKICEISLPSGSHISIPAAALVDENGNPVQGKVDVRYREFKDQLDMLLAGIPMSYDSGGVNYALQSAGMFQIEVSQNGRPLKLARGKSVTASVPSSDKGNYNLYVYDSAKNNWVYKQPLANKAADNWTAFFNGTKAYRTFSSYLESHRYYNGAAYNYDTLSYMDRYNSPAYVQTQKFSYFYQLKKSGTDSNGQVIYHYSGWRKGFFTFGTQRTRDNKVRLIFREKSYYAHPELNSFRNFSFITTNTYDYTDFREQYVKKLWFDVRLEYHGEGSVTLWLKDNAGMHAIELELAKPVSTFKRKYEETHKAVVDAILERQYVSRKTALARTFIRYDKRILKTEVAFDRNIRKQLQHYTRLNQTAADKAYELAYHFMNPYEASLNREAWTGYVDSCNKVIVANEIKTQGFSSGIVRSFQMSGFGIYNCDQVRRLKSPVVTTLYFKDSSGNIAHASSSYVLTSSINGVLSYDTDPEKGKASVAFDKVGRNALFEIIGNGKVGIISSDAFENIDRNKKSQTAQVEILNASDLNISELRKRLKF
jgi:hypothetical protein